MADAVPDAADHLPLSLLFSSHRRRRRRRRPSSPPPSAPLAGNSDSPPPQPYLNAGDLVWVKAFPYTWWPGRIRCRKKSRSKVLVSFFGEGREKPQWFRESRVLGFEENCGRMVGMNRRKVGVEIGLAMEELGRRTMAGLMCSCWRSVLVARVGGEGSVTARQVSRARKGFFPKEVAEFVRGMGVCGFEGKEWSDAGKVVCLAAQVVAFRRYVNVAGLDVVGDGFRPERLLGVVRKMAVASGVFDGSGDVVTQVMAFRSFASGAPGWVFQELAGVGGGLCMDDSEDSMSGSCSEGSESDMSGSEGSDPNSRSASFIEKEKSLVDFPMDGSKILEGPSEISLGTKLEKEDVEMVDQNIMSDCSDLLITSSIEDLPQTIPSSKGQMLFDECNMLYFKGILKHLHIIAADPCYFGSERLESLSECILKYRKLTLACTGDYKLRRSNKFSDVELEQLFCLFKGAGQNDQIDRIITIDDPMGGVELSSRDNLDEATSISLDVCVTSHFTGDQFREVASACSMEEYSKIFSETILETKEEQEISATVVNKDVNFEIQSPLTCTGVPADSSIEFLPEMMSSTKEQLAVSPMEENKTSYVQEMLMQLHCIATDTCFFGKKRHKSVYTTFLKVRELIYTNISNFAFASGTDCCGYSLNSSNLLSVLENEQLTNLPDDNTKTYKDDQPINSRYGVKGKSNLSANCIYGNPSTSFVDGSSSTFFRDKVSGDGLDQVVTSSIEIDMHRASPLSLVKEPLIPEAEPTKITHHVSQKISPSIHEIQSQLRLLAIDLYYAGSKRIKFVSKSILRYRNLAFQNIPDLSSPLNSGKCILNGEQCQASTYDPLFHDSVKEPCTDNKPNSAEGPRKEVQKSLAHHASNENQADDSVRTETPFPFHVSGDGTSFHPSPVTYTDTNNLVHRKGTSCGKEDVKIASPLRDPLGNCEGSLEKSILEEPVSIDNLKMLKTLPLSSEYLFSTHGDTSHADVDFAVDATMHSSFLSNSSCESSHSQGKVYAEPEVIDGKHGSRSSNCSSTLPMYRKRNVARQSMFDQTVFCGQSKQQKLKHATSSGRLYASQLVADNSPLVADDLSKLQKIQYVNSSGRLYASPLVADTSPLVADDSSPLVADDSKLTSNVQQISANYSSIGLSKSLCMKFPKGFKIPSKEDLEKKFSVFGLLDHSRTRIFFYTGVAQVVFLHPIDARTAYRYVNRKKSFIHADMRFWFDDDDNHSERNGGQALSMTRGQPSLNVKSCLKKPKAHRENDQKKKRQVKFVVDNYSSHLVASTGRGNETCCASVPENSQKMKPDISGPMFQLLSKCDELVDEVKKNLGSEMFYSYLYTQLISYSALPPSTSLITVPILD